MLPHNNNTHGQYLHPTICNNRKHQNKLISYNIIIETCYRTLDHITINHTAPKQ